MDALWVQKDLDEASTILYHLEKIAHSAPVEWKRAVRWNARTDGLLIGFFSTQMAMRHILGKMRLEVEATPSTEDQTFTVTQDSEVVLHPVVGDRTFHCFEQLPAELRYMVWETAANPPPCSHYLSSLQLDATEPEDQSTSGTKRQHETAFPMRGRQPASILLGDAGLWSACRESREAVRRVYRRYQAKYPRLPPPPLNFRLPLTSTSPALNPCGNADFGAGVYATHYLGCLNRRLCDLREIIPEVKPYLELKGMFQLEIFYRAAHGQTNKVTVIMKKLFGVPEDEVVEGDFAFRDRPLPLEQRINRLFENPWSVIG